MEEEKKEKVVEVAAEMKGEGIREKLSIIKKKKTE